MAYNGFAIDRYVDAEAVTKQLDELIRQPVWGVRPEELEAIRAKTLVIAGTKDLIKPSQTRQIAEHIPDSRLVFVEGNHFIAGKNPEEFNRAVLDFLTE